jgi:hypothetical protein
MTRRQTEPEQWLIIDRHSDHHVCAAMRRLPQRSGVLFLHDLSPIIARRVRHLSKLRCLAVVMERRGTARRVHDIGELRKALLERSPLILLSPIFPTSSHPDWQPLPRMRAATLARLTGRNAVALGGMNALRYAKIAPLGFIGWAGISAFRI